MKYEEIYNCLIQKRRDFPLIKTGDFSIESHHIVPKSCGGSDDADNIVNLTLREHYIAHLLLVKIAEKKRDNEMLSKMCQAVFYLINGRKRKTGMHVNSHLYEILKLSIIPSWLGRHHTQYSRDKIRKAMTKNGITGKRTWLNKNGIVKYVANNKVEDFLADGWQHGRPGYKPRKGMHGKVL